MLHPIIGESTIMKDKALNNVTNLEPESFYHVFNRTNNKESLFKGDNDYLFFLDKAQRYLCPYFEVYAYCLVGNHFHFLLKTKSPNNILATLRKLSSFEITKAERLILEYTDLTSDMIHDMYRMQIIRLLTAYSKNYNRLYGQSGHVFYKPFKKILVKDSEYIKTLIHYIHKNPVKHNLTNNFKYFEWSSYYDYLNNEDKITEVESGLKLFGGLENFNNSHNANSNYDEIAELLFE
jgi:REP element-mobilizing transposase RayT